MTKRRIHQNVWGVPTTTPSPALQKLRAYNVTRGLDAHCPSCGRTVAEEDFTHHAATCKLLLDDVAASATPGVAPSTPLEAIITATHITVYAPDAGSGQSIAEWPLDSLMAGGMVDDTFMENLVDAVRLGRRDFIATLVRETGK